MAGIKRWETLEKVIQAELAEAQVTKPLAWTRYFDTKSAGNLMPPQPADFQACLAGAVCMLEAKFSANHESLRECFAGSVKSHQLASARIWTRAGARYIILFHSGKPGLTECWDGRYLAECRAKGERLSLDLRRIHETVEQAVRKEVGYG